MIISHEYKFIYIHIGRTGGTSFEDAYCRHFKLDSRSATHWPEVFGNRDIKHVWAEELKRKIDNHTWQKYFKFAFVRNPYDWLVSAWHHQKEHQDHGYRWLIESWICHNTFREFLQALLNNESHLITPYSAMITDGQGNILIDFVGRYENFMKDLSLVHQKVGLPKLPMGRNASSKHKQFTSYYTDEAADFVYNHYEMEFKMFGYEKDSWKTERNVSDKYLTESIG